MRRVGLFGGSFDPPHIGHIAIADFILNDRQLDEILFVVSHIQWQKAVDREILDSHHRFEMVKLAIRDFDHFSVSGIEIDRGGDSVTVETLEVLHNQDPTAQYELIIGEDIASTTGTKAITYTNSFYASPAVGIAAQNMATGDTYTISSKSATGFSIAFTNSSGSGINRTFDYVAQGYGLKS